MVVIIGSKINFYGEIFRFVFFFSVTIFYYMVEY